MRNVGPFLWILAALALTGVSLFARGNVAFAASGTATAAQLVLSGVLLAASLYVVLSRKFPEDTLKWAYTTIGTIVGFWLKGVSG